MTSLSISNRRDKKRISENLVQAAIVYIMLLAVFSAHDSVFKIGISIFQMAVVLGISMLFLLSLMWNRKHRMKILSLGMVLLVTAAVLLRKSLYGGIVSYINKFIELYNQYYSNLKKMIIAESTEYSSVVALFFLGVVLGLILYIVLEWKKGILLSILIIALPVIFSAIVGKMPMSQNWWLMIAATCLYLIVYRGQDSYISVKEVSLTASALTIIVVISMVIQPMIIDYKNMYLEEYKQIRKDIIDSQVTSRADWKDTASSLKNKTDNFAGGVSKGELSKNASVNPTGEVAMEIVMTQKPSETLYLKAYVGSEYTGDSWDEISTRELSEILPRVGGNEKRRELMNEPFRRVSEGDYVTSSNPPRVEEITIKLVNASKEFGYTPYCAEITDEHKVHKDLYVEGDFTKTRKYSFYPFSVYSGIDANHLSEYYVYPSYGQVGFLEFFGLELAEPSELESAYHEFVKTAYVDNHKELELLRQYCDSINKRNVEGELLYLFDNGFYYSKNPGEMPADMDFAEGFMFSRNVGYCVHFATATTLVYQMCGYPARYVEGYAVSPSAFTRYEDGTYRATVTDENAHAWCEIFDEELGWIARDFTPNTGEFTNAIISDEEWQVDDGGSDKDFGNENSDEEIVEDNPQELNENIDNPQNDEDIVDNLGENGTQGGIFAGDYEISKGGNSENDIWKTVKEILWKVLLVTVAIVFLIIAFILQRKIRYAKLLKSFKQKKDNKGVLSIYNAIYELCVLVGFQTERENEKEKLKELTVQFPQFTAEEWNQLYVWAEMAAFSNEKLSGEVQKEMYHLYRRIRNEILKTSSFKKKIWLLYIKAA